MMRAFVFTGSRGWEDVDTVIDVVTTLAKPYVGLVGDADGFDTLVTEALADAQTPHMVFKAKWDKYGRAAGPLRNGWMLDWLFRLQGRTVIAGWDGKSPGTADCIRQARERGFDVMRVFV